MDKGKIEAMVTKFSEKFAKTQNNDLFISPKQENTILEMA
jgi:hypothetical protein